jgi:hypothetical protein
VQKDDQLAMRTYLGASQSPYVVFVELRQNRIDIIHLKLAKEQRKAGKPLNKHDEDPHQDFSSSKR